MAGIKENKMPNRSSKNSKTRAVTECKCLSCAKPVEEKYEDLTMLGEEACFMRYDKCTERPHTCGYMEIRSEATVMIG